MQLSQACAGRWGDILPRFGVSAKFLKNRHGECPACGGKDRFRYDNRNNRGDFYCNQCGAGDGFKLIELTTGKTFKEIAKEIENIVGSVPMRDLVQTNDLTLSQIKELKNNLWAAARAPIENGIVMRYLANRGLAGYMPSADIREVNNYSWIDPVTKKELSLTGMVAMVRKPDGSADTLHQTTIHNGSRGNRFLSRGGISQGVSVRLFDDCETVLGIAEGIETAIAASLRFSVPVDAAINQKRMLTWLPREGVKTVLIMSDHDKNFSGQSHSYQLANRLAAKGYEVKVMVPQFEGWDWNDELINRLERGVA